jgi:hypothetical protein
MVFSIFEVNWKVSIFQTPVHYGPVGLVIIFLEFIRVELDHTPKRESVPHNLFYKCANL